MKRILSLVLILILSVGMLVACELPELPFFPTTTTTTTTPTTPAHNCEYDAESAKDFLASMYVGWLDNNATPNDHSVLASMLRDGVKYIIEWSVDNEAVVLTPSEDGTEILVNVPDRGAEDVAYTLTGTVIAPDGCEAELSYELYVPAFEINSYDDYANAENGTLLTLEGVITGIVKKADGWKSNSVYFQCEDGGYYAYNVSDEAIANLKVGMTIQASGTYEVYNGTHELMNASFTVVDETIKTVTPVDYTERFINAADLDAKELVYAQALLVTLKGVEISTQDASNGYLYFKLGNHEGYLRISSSNNIPSKAVTEEITAAHADHFGWKADVTGLVSIYSGKFYLIPVDGNAFSNWVEVEKTPEQKVDSEKGSLSIDSSYSADGTYPLPLAGKNYSDVVISWASNNELVVINEDGTMTVKVPDDKTEVTLTATLTCGEATATAEVKITLNKTLTSIKDANEIASSKEHNTYTEDKYLVGGVITEIASDKYGNLYFTDGVETFYVYGLYDADGNRYDAMATKPAVGDYIVVLTALGQYNGTAQGKNATLISISNPKDIPSANEMASAQEHNTYTEDKYVITGTIDEIVNDKYGNVYIVDEAGNRFYVYGLYDIAGNRYDGMAVKPAVGDVITVLTALGQYNGTAQGKNATLVAHTPKAAEEPSDPVDPNPEEPNPEEPSTPATPEEVLNALYGLADGSSLEGSFTLTGKITSLDNYNNPTIVVEGFDSKPVYCYKLTDSRFVVGATITVTATTLKNYKGTYEMMNCTLDAIVLPEGSETPEEPKPEEPAPDVPVGDALATFDFGANGDASHYDGDGNKPFPNGTVFTSGNYTLDITSNEKTYDCARDAMGNSCIKLGTSSKAGKITFTVPEDVTSVVIYVAGYKASNAKINVNGTDYTISTLSNNGDYTVITVDTTTNKTVTFTTASGGWRCMINTIIYK